MNSAVNFTPQPFYPQERILATTEQEAGWTLKPSCTF